MTASETMLEERVSSILEEVGQCPDKIDCPGGPEVGVDPVVHYFETSRIKDPLFGWLHSHGWNHKGFLGKLFTR